MEVHSSFLNVDLEVKSKDDLSPLLASLGRKVNILHHARIGRWYWLRVDLYRQPRNPIEGIKLFCGLIKSLPLSSKKLWDDAQVREFDIGIQVGLNPSSTEWLLDARTISMMASVNARVEVTLYSPTHPLIRVSPI
jgi:hypothetical protein